MPKAIPTPNPTRAQVDKPDDGCYVDVGLADVVEGSEFFVVEGVVVVARRSELCSFIWIKGAKI